jgi:H/ACA ribonucleoprotein complex subunit 3
MNCGEFGLEEKCSCGSKKIRIIPPKFSPEDKYAKYRRKAKENDFN